MCGWVEGESIHSFIHSSTLPTHPPTHRTCFRETLGEKGAVDGRREGGWEGGGEGDGGGGEGEEVGVVLLSLCFEGERSLALFGLALEVLLWERRRVGGCGP